MYRIDFNSPKPVHFVGIGGISMSGLAKILLKKGFKITGSDMTISPIYNNFPPVFQRYSPEFPDKIVLMPPKLHFPYFVMRTAYYVRF